MPSKIIENPNVLIAHEAHKRLAKALSTWYRLQGEDKTFFEELSLGRIFSFQLIEPLSFLFDQAVKGIDPALSSDHHDNSDAYRPAPKSQLRRTDLKASAFRLLYRLAGFRRWKTPRRSILILASPSNRLLWNYWLEHLSEYPDLRLDFLLNHPPGLSNSLGAIWNGARLFDPRPSPLSESQHERIAQISSALQNLSSDKEWQSLFCLGNIDFSKTFIERHLAAFIEQLEPLAVRYLSLAKEFDAAPPDLVLLPQEVSAEARGLLVLCRKKNIPIWFLPHGMAACYRSDENVHLSEYEADRILTWGEVDKKNYIRAGVPESKLSLCGLPAFDPFFPLAPPRPLQRVKGSTIMLLGFAHHSWFTHWGKNYENYFVEILRILDRLKVKRVIFKLHPGRPKLELYRRLVSEIQPRCEVELCQSESFQSVLDRSDCVIGGFSTAFAETLLGGKDYFLFDYNPDQVYPFPIYPPFESNQPYVALSFEALERNLIESRPLPREAILREFCGVSGKEEAWHWSRRLFTEFRNAIQRTDS